MYHAVKNKYTGARFWVSDALWQKHSRKAMKAGCVRTGVTRARLTPTVKPELVVGLGATISGPDNNNAVVIPMPEKLYIYAKHTDGRYMILEKAFFERMSDPALTLIYSVSLAVQPTRTWRFDPAPYKVIEETAREMNAVFAAFKPGKMTELKAA